MPEPITKPQAGAALAGGGGAARASHHMSEAEMIERAGLRALHAVAGGELRRRLGLDRARYGDAEVSMAAALPGSAITINRAVGLGRERPPQRADIDGICAAYRGAGIERFFLQPDPSTNDDLVAPLCEAAGLTRARAWQKFERDMTRALPEAGAHFDIREATPEEGPEFARIVCNAFDLGEVAEPWLARLPEAEGWHAYIAWEGARAVGCGALFVRGAAAFTDFGATDPAFRQRGAQSANLAHRLRAAREMGVERVHTCTGVEVPGDPQHSYANILKAGFHETHVRQAWQPGQGRARRYQGE
ncbi:GNAT family N-acetyltransferase [Sediminimonas qiaohouensis]|uniref:GNAT family N-acetyltransferase n=1 Tax=Sediminimonas qiaohouensis TaxID=552061 RepID=UPI00040D19B6|nr:hypothetical protein [Sediminimonas qiaohouensis]